MRARAGWRPDFWTAPASAPPQRAAKPPAQGSAPAAAVQKSIDLIQFQREIGQTEMGRLREQAKQQKPQGQLKVLKEG